jgi:hypothetical protein
VPTLAYTTTTDDDYDDDDDDNSNNNSHKNWRIEIRIPTPRIMNIVATYRFIDRRISL